MEYVNTSSYNLLESSNVGRCRVGAHEHSLDDRSLSSQRFHWTLDTVIDSVADFLGYGGAATIAIFAICFVTYVISLVRFRDSKAMSRSTPSASRLPGLPYTIPFVYNVLELVWSPSKFLDGIMRTYGCIRPFRVRAGPLEFCVVANRDHIQTLFRSSKALTSKPGTLFALSRILNTPKEAIPFYAADDSGMATKPRKESTVRHEDRIHYWQAHTSQKWLSGISLQLMSDNYLSVLNDELETRFRRRMDRNTEFVPFPADSRLHICYQSNDGRLIPRWWKPEAYKVRDRLLKKIGEWTENAHRKSDCWKIGPEDENWDPHFGTKLMKAREHAYLQMPAMSLGARASETLGLIFASNGNAVPSIFWYVTEALKNKELQDRLLSEAMTCFEKNGKLNVSALASKPLLQSVYAEVLRLRVAITVLRNNEYDNTILSPYSVPKQTPMVIFSRIAALNRDAWAVRLRTLDRPLEDFWPERFLVYPREDEPPPKACKSELPCPSGREGKKPEFSLDGLTGCWIPFGGGQRMCPGRHFAKHEILGTFSILFYKFDIEVVNRDEALNLQPDLGWVPYGGLPPSGKLPVRIRRKISLASSEISSH